MNISPKSKFRCGALIFVSVGLAIGVIAAQTNAQVMSPIFILFFVWIVIGSWLLLRISCPNCGTSVLYQGRLGGLSMYAGFVRRKCQNCGHDLTATRRGD